MNAYVEYRINLTFAKSMYYLFLLKESTESLKKMATHEMYDDGSDQSDELSSLIQVHTSYLLEDIEKLEKRILTNGLIQDIKNISLNHALSAIDLDNNAHHSIIKSLGNDSTLKDLLKLEKRDIIALKGVGNKNFQKIKHFIDAFDM